MSVILPFPDGPQRPPYAPEDMGAAQEELEVIEAEVARRHLKPFIEKVWHIVEPDFPLVWNWHLDELCLALEAVSRGELQRVIINIPPGTMKSLLVGVFWKAWEWASNPKLRYLNASYGAHLTIRDNLRLRDIVQSEWYQYHYGVEFASDQNAKELLKTTDGGWSFATSVGGAGTGEHPDRIVIDDPHTAEQARSDVERQKAANWFDRTASTRGLMRSPAMILIMQRLHEDDLSGHLLKRGGWVHLRFPMRYMVARPKTDSDAGYTPDPRDHRTQAGDLLFPQLLPEEKVRQVELDLGPYGTAGQLQQIPAPEGGGLFKREWFKFVDAAPVVARRVRGWDTAGTENDGDWTSGTKIAESEGLFYVEDRVHGQLGPAGVDSLMLQTAQADGWGVGQREEKEPGGSGKAVVEARAKALVGYDYKWVLISGDKVTRAKPYRAQVEAGNVFLVRGDWNEEYIRQLCAFPTGANDDDVDSSSTAFNAVLLEPSPFVQVTTLAGFG
jgi:predicted phage terminase large subunit-like protein